jgi:hypothetical protein
MKHCSASKHKPDVFAVVDLARHLRHTAKVAAAVDAEEEVDRTSLRICAISTNGYVEDWHAGERGKTCTIRVVQPLVALLRASPDAVLR